MSALAAHVATVAKLAPSLLAHPGYSYETAKLLLSRLTLAMKTPADYRGGQIRQVSIRITDLCNLRCHTCGQWGDNGYLLGQPMRELLRAEVPVDRYIALLHDLAARGHRPGLYLWGGEPMLYRGAVCLIEEAAKLGMPTSIATNGTKVAENAEALVRAPMFIAQVSIDGHNSDIHNACRPGANPSTDNFSTVVGALDALKAERKRQGGKLPILAGLCTINQRNADRLVDIYDAFHDKLDFMIFYLSWWIDAPSAAAHTTEFQRRFGTRPVRHEGWIGGWRPTDYSGLSRQLATLARRALSPRGPGVLLVPDLTSPEDLERYYTDHGATFGFDRCTSIYRAVEINANGDVSPCRDYNDYVVGNIKTHTITDLWDNDAYRAFRRSLKCDGLMPVCTRCCGMMGN
ncbi:MAG TPA: SPASM domain-containing protein [Beijerinckiaceae bacterium]|nr:SPASM domain-containing protein [Beijerinckiaceae bacterium]